MKLKYIISGLICSLLFATTSCTLDHNPLETYSDVTEGVDKKGEGEIFKNKEAVVGHLQTLYNQMRDRQEHWHMDLILLGDSHSDNAYGGSTGAEVLPFENNAIEGSNSVMKRDWERYLEDVGRANKLIYGIDEVTDATLTDAERKQYKAEALIFRAMVYFDMVRIWSSVPLITFLAPDITAENIAEVYPLYFPKQSPEEDTYKQIEQDLLLALESAPNSKATDKTIFSKSVARTLLAKIYAEKPLRDYDKVIKYADEVTADGFDLVTDFKDLFGMNDLGTDARARNTKEAILEAHFAAGRANWVTWMFGRNLVDWDQSFSWPKWVTPSRDLVNAFKSEGDQKRQEESIVYYKCTWNIYYPADSYAFTYKYRSAYNSIIKFRYADVLLLKAEAMIMKDAPDLVGAAAIIDKVRERAGISKLDASIKGSKNSMLDALLKERRLELAFEGHRWFDLVRLNKVEEVMNAVYGKDSGRKPRVNAFNKYSYRLPIPQAALDENVNLVQNLGY